MLFVTSLRRNFLEVVYTLCGPLLVLAAIPCKLYVCVYVLRTWFRNGHVMDGLHLRVDAAQQSGAAVGPLISIIGLHVKAYVLHVSV